LVISRTLYTRQKRCIYEPLSEVMYSLRNSAISLSNLQRQSVIATSRTVGQLLTRSQLIQSVSQSLCDSWASCYEYWIYRCKKYF